VDAEPIVEPIPADCLPFGGDEKKLLELLRGPKVADDGKIIGGTYDGMTPGEVLRHRDEYNRLCGE
jgi:hypothetical protein